MEKVIEKVEGMGAIPSEQGTTFRVWAPNADKVFVTGTFNDWDNSQFELDLEENGYWSGSVPKAKTGNEYKYVIHNGDQILQRNDPYAKEMTNSNGNSVITNLDFKWEDQDFQMKSWNNLVIYELHVGTFNRKDLDSVATFDSIIEKIPYLKKLGINCVEILPIAEFAGGISWGYNPSYPFAIERDYGGAEAFARMVNAFHKADIGVVLDVVYNHFGPSDMDLWQFDGWSDNDKGGIYFYNDHRSVTPWGDSRPDYGREEVRRYIRDNAFMWIEDYHCDGLRMDATSYIRYEGGGLGYDSEIPEGNMLMRDINAEIKAKYPGKLTIAEDLKGAGVVTLSSDFGGLGYGSQWDMNFVHPVRKFLIEQGDEYRDMQALVDAILFKYNNDVFERIIYTESHDEVANGQARVPEEIEPGNADSFFGKKRAILGLAITLTSPGIPMLFQGQEFIEDEYFQDSEALDWKQQEKHVGITRMVSDMIKIRTEYKSESEGLKGQYTKVIHFDDDNKVLAYARSTNEDFSNSTVVLLNLSNDSFEDFTFGIPYAEEYQLVFNSDWKGYDEEFTDMVVSPVSIFNEEYNGEACKAVTNLPAYTALIYTPKNK
ncbi:alpha-amylase family glycosyl hydrolase [Flavobacterium algicola]|uniref:alpha-amylase family glycosyl hydrolase n=1 Tax=Flavobacterium algicola TaxID=556529 RepID=UPI001EFE607E|nr:alpha-amylase family glycosyl hydrolase [Flavobacterium algicola]MCG9793227.1 alpha amylase C-terminal domain-containing protein [Flavobacterium algicola]